MIRNVGEETAGTSARIVGRLNEPHFDEIISNQELVRTQTRILKL